MPKVIYVSEPDREWIRTTDFYYTGVITNATAAQTLCPAATYASASVASAICYNAISTLMIDNQSGVSKTFQIQDGAGTPNVLIEDFTVNASAGPFILKFDRGLELTQPVPGMSINIVANASGSFSYLITGYKIAGPSW